MDRRQQTPAQLNIERFHLLIVGVLATLLSLYIVVQAMKGGTNSLIAATVVIGGIAWIVSGREAWWIPIPIATSIGGLVWVGFRIYTHELGVLMAAAALLPAIAINRRAVEQYRGKLPWVVYALLGFLFAHLFTSLMINRYDNGTGYGNIVRTYVGAIWPLLLIVALFHFGNTKYIRLAIMVTYIGLAFRVVIALYSYYFPGLLFFRGFNVFFLLSEHGGLDLRGAPLRLLILTLGLSAASRDRMRTLLHLLVAMTSAWLLLMGSGRVTVAMLGVIPIFWLLVQRRYALLIFASAAMLAIILTLNLNPDLLYMLPRGSQRALSILLTGGSQSMSIQAGLDASNLWHQELFRLGKTRWLATPLSFLFGNRVFPFDPTMGSYWQDFYFNASVAASIAKYERSLWTILATTGVVGGILYVFSFYYLLREPVRLLFRDRFSDFNHVIYFLAATHALLFFLFSPVSGAFPGVELMWAGIAYIVAKDEARRLNKEEIALKEAAAARAAEMAPHRIKLY